MSRFSVRDDLRGDDQIFDGDRQIELSEAVDLLNAAYPDRDTPREEVTEGWWACDFRFGDVSKRRIVQIEKCDWGYGVWQVGANAPSPIANFTDFLPVPAWLVEGLNDSESPKGSKL